MSNELPRELMESYCGNAQEAVMDGFRNSILASTLTPAIERLMETCYRMGFESGWRIREQHIPSDGWVTSPDGLSRRRVAPNAAVLMVPSQSVTMRLGSSSGGLSASAGESKQPEGIAGKGKT